ncbi:uncharacterized protein Tco025E_03399 [Trypanosoma conorhini]|uniref:Uncharacterized protein n=1 Tax=Trypanosoma conorhini TaxID=83891 RepID=A0A3R7L6P3_9TRYP|nr:uncharacterized protein Tco025E_03399 [Trypanosoma conorhini]RNF22131.1 hypothetical protein Tco025E_03399 [Trypanosoma conorhini]
MHSKQYNLDTSVTLIDPAHSAEGHYNRRNGDPGQSNTVSPVTGRRDLGSRHTHDDAVRADAHERLCALRGIRKYTHLCEPRVRGAGGAAPAADGCGVAVRRPCKVQRRLRRLLRVGGANASPRGEEEEEEAGHESHGAGPHRRRRCRLRSALANKRAA